MSRIYFPLLIFTLYIHLYQSISLPIASTDQQKTPRSRKALPRVHARDVPASNSRVASTHSECQPRTEDFESCTDSLPSTWVSLSRNPNSYNMEPTGGVNLVLNPAAGPVAVSKDGGKTNDKLGDGATLNSTFALLYGKVSFTVTATDVPGSVTALVLFGTASADEIDVEILGGDPTHWQTNVFRPAPGEAEPLYGVFGGVESYPNGTTASTHTYAVDWSPERIVWSVDGQVSRTLTPDQTLRNGYRHYPSALSRIQIGLWDGSSPAGTSEWAKGPIPWSKRQNKPISALIRSVTVECPY